MSIYLLHSFLSQNILEFFMQFATRELLKFVFGQSNIIHRETNMSNPTKRLRSLDILYYSFFFPPFFSCKFNNRLSIKRIFTKSLSFIKKKNRKHQHVSLLSNTSVSLIYNIQQNLKKKYLHVIPINQASLTSEKRVSLSFSLKTENSREREITRVYISLRLYSFSSDAAFIITSAVFHSS